MTRERKIWGGPTETREHRGNEEIRKEIASSAAHTEMLTSAYAVTTADQDQLAAVRKKYNIEPFHFTTKLKPLFELDRAIALTVEAEEIEDALLRAKQYLSSSRTRTRHDEERGKNTVAALEAKQKAHLDLQGKEPPKAPAALAPGSGYGEAVDAALALMFGDGQAILPARRDTERLGVIADRRIIFTAARVAIGQLIEQLRSVATKELHERLRKAHDAMLIEIYRAAQQFARTAAAEREFRAAITGAGYAARPDLTPMPLVTGAALVLGSETDWSSQIAEYRRFLEGRRLV